MREYHISVSVLQMRMALGDYETFRDAAKRAGCDPSRLRQLRLAGRLPEAIMLGRTWHLPRGLKIPVDNGSRKR